MPLCTQVITHAQQQEAHNAQRSHVSHQLANNISQSWHDAPPHQQLTLLLCSGTVFEAKLILHTPQGTASLQADDLSKHIGEAQRRCWGCAHPSQARIWGASGFAGLGDCDVTGVDAAVSPFTRCAIHSMPSTSPSPVFAHVACPGVHFNSDSAAP